MTFRQIEFFITVCRFKSISKASSHLLISQQAVSKALLELEEELGCKLLTRTNTGVAPTSYGTYALQEFELILRKKEDIALHIQNMKTSPKEPLLVGMSFGIVSALSHDFLPEFTEKFPYIELNYSDYPDRQLEKRLVKGEFDLAIIAGPVENDELYLEVIRKDPVYLCIPEDHPFYNNTTISIQDLSDQKFVMFSDRFNIRHNFISSCKHAGFQPDILLTSSDFNSLRELAYGTKSLFVIPEHTVQRDNPHYRHYRFPDPFFTWDITLAMRKNMIMTKSMEAFKQHLLSSAMST